MSQGTERPEGGRRRLLIDVTPLRRSRDLRWLVAGELVSVLGNQLTTVAVPVQVYQLTHSSLDVGLVSLAPLFPLIAGRAAGRLRGRRHGPAPAADGRAAAAGAAAAPGWPSTPTSGTALWPLFVLPGAGRLLQRPGQRRAQSPSCRTWSAGRRCPTANAIFQALFQFGLVAGPAVAGLLLAGAGVRFVYWLDVGSFAVAADRGASLISPQPPAGEHGHRPGLRSILEGLRFVRGRQAIQGAYLIDINAMVFGMPRALFPALATTAFGGGATTVGFLYAAPGAGALIGAVTTGWVSRIRRQGRAVIVAVIVWGAAITVLRAGALAAGRAGAARPGGLRRRHLGGVPQHDHPAAVPDALRGRLSGLQIAVVAGGPRSATWRPGAVAAGFGDTTSVVSGGLACIVGAVLLARLLPGFRRQQAVPSCGPGAEELGDGNLADGEPRQ